MATYVPVNRNSPTMLPLSQPSCEIGCITSATVLAIGVGYPITFTTGVVGSPPVVIGYVAGGGVIHGVLSLIETEFPTDPSNNKRYIAASTATRVKVAIGRIGDVYSIQGSTNWVSTDNNKFADLVIAVPDVKLGTQNLQIDTTTKSASATGLPFNVLGYDTSSVQNVENTGESYSRLICVLTNGGAVAAAI